MSASSSPIERFAGGLLRTVAVMLIVYGGTCACMMATSRPGDEFRPSNAEGWGQVAFCLPVGLAAWLVGSWLIRRNRPKRND